MMKKTDNSRRDPKAHLPDGTRQDAHRRDQGEAAGQGPEYWLQSFSVNVCSPAAPLRQPRAMAWRAETRGKVHNRYSPNPDEIDE